jgi:hypothetical protein
VTSKTKSNSNLAKSKANDWQFNFLRNIIWKELRMAGYSNKGSSGARLSRLAAKPSSSSSYSSFSNPSSNSSQSYASISFATPISILMIGVGIVGYLLIDNTKGIASVPAIIGLSLIILRLLSKLDFLRKFPVHCSVLLGILGFLAGLAGSVYAAIIWFSSGGLNPIIVFIISILTIFLCGIFCLFFIVEEY